MKKAYILSLILLFIINFSCMRKKETVEQRDNSLNEKGLTKNELCLFLCAEIKEYTSRYAEEIRNFYIVFKETNTNDTLFEFSYIDKSCSKLHEYEYKGFFKIDSFNIAIYDEKGIGLKWYKDTLNVSPFPNVENYIFYNEKGETKMRMVSIGRIKNNVFEVLPATLLIENNWHKYFE